MKIGIIWSNGCSIEILKFHFSTIINKIASYSSYFNNKYEFKLIKEDDLFSELNKINSFFSFNSWDAVFILAELTWHNHNLTNFYGVKVAQKLRFHNINAPIFICSFLPEKYFLNSGQYKILGFRGHYFIHLPEGFSEKTEIYSLSEMELMDCKMHFCDLEGTIREIYHRKQHALPENDLEKAKNIVFELFKQIKELNDLPSYLLPVIDNLIYEVQKKNSVNDLRLFLKTDDSVILAYLNESDKNAYSINHDEISGNWEILIMEDVPKDVEALTQALIDAGLNKERIHIVPSYERAKEIIEHDIFNLITVTICDYRLEENGNLKCKQGYEFVQWLSQQQRFNEIFVYSGMARKFLKDTFKRFNIKVQINSKYDIISDRINELVTEIIEKGNEHYLCLLNQPSIGVWDYSLKYFYAYYRSRTDYDLLEQQISYEARRYINQIKYYSQLKVRFHDDEDSGNLAKYQEQGWFNQLLKEAQIINPLKFITSDLFNSDKTPKQPEEKDFYYFEIFKRVLIARRLELYFMGYAKEFKDRRVMAGILLDGCFKPKSNASVKQLYDHICIGDFDYPLRMLVEERNWFKNIMNIDVEDPKSLAEKENIGFFEEFIEQVNRIFFESYKNISDQTDEFRELESYIIKDKDQVKLICHSIADLNRVIYLLQIIYKGKDNYMERINNLKDGFDKLLNLKIIRR